MNLVLSFVSLFLIFGIGSALHCVKQKNLQPKDVAITVHKCPSFAKSCYTITTIDNVERGCSTEVIEENKCEMKYADDIFRRPITYAISETCYCNTDFCNSPKLFERYA